MTTPADDVDRIPLTRSVHYAVRGMPEVPNQYGPGVLAPSEITLTYREASDSQLGRVHAYVAGRIWVDGKELPLLPGGLYGQHYFDGLDGWPEWLAGEARLHDPAAATPAGPAPATDRDTLRQLITTAVDRVFEAWRQGLGDTRPQDAVTDAVLAELLGPIPAGTDAATWTAIRAIQLMNEAGRQRDEALAAVLPAPDQQAAVVRDAAIRLWHQTTGLTEYGRGARWAIGELRRLAGDAQQDEAACAHPHGQPGITSLLEHVGIDTSGGVTVDGRTVAAPCTCGGQPAREAQQDPTQDGPRRGDWFEQWLVTQRDRHGWQGTNDRVIWDALDTVVGLYRLHADSGTPLGEHVSEEPATGEAQQGPAQDGEAEHSGGNAEDCPVCRPEIDKTVLYPWICPGPTAPARSGQPETGEEA